MKPALRFCMITTFYPPYHFGGDGIFVQRLALELARRGHRVEIIHCLDSYRILSRSLPAAERVNHANLTIHRLKSPFGFLSPLASQQTGLPIFKSARLRQILQQPFDVIHYHNISLFGPGVLQYGEAIKLYTLHEYWLVCPMHTLFQFNNAPCESLRCVRCSLSFHRPPQWWRKTNLLADALRHIDAFISPSQFGKAAHQQRGFQQSITHLPNFAPSGIECEPADDTPSKPYFLFVGRLEKLKGLQTLIPIFRRYRKASLLIAGGGNYAPTLRRLAAGDDNIRFLHHVDEGQLQSLYQRAKAVIVPSICLEMFPTVIVEAFRQQVPVIARRLGGMTEMVAESGGGLLYTTDAELIAAMDRLLAETDDRQALGQRGHQAYLQNWTVEAHLQRYFALIDEVSIRKKGQPLIAQSAV